VEYSVVVHISSGHSLFHAAKVYAGLDALAAQGVIGLRVTSRDPFPADVVLLSVTARGSNAQRLVAIDLYDHSDRFCPAALANCDVYFKRNLFRPHMQRLLPAEGAKVLPFGLSHPCVGHASRRWAMWHWGRAVVGALRRSPREAIGRLRPWLQDLRLYHDLSHFAAFEQHPDAVVEPVVLFQTRVWEPEESTENLDQINEERVALIRRLRAALGTRFRGGVLPTPFARQRYGDVLLTEGYRQGGYISVMQRHLVGINTRGLHRSIAFKVPEYLAASVCMVSEPLRNELPHSLSPEQHYLEFQSHDECIAQCERLLSNPDEARAMRWQNFTYYRRWVSPPAQMLDCLERAFGAGADVRHDAGSSRVSGTAIA